MLCDEIYDPTIECYFTYLFVRYALNFFKTATDPEFPRQMTPTIQMGVSTYYLDKFYQKLDKKEEIGDNHPPPLKLVFKIKLCSNLFYLTKILLII